MQLFYTKKQKKILLISTITAFLLAIVIACSSLYLNDYYRADITAIESFGHVEKIEEEALQDGTLVYKPKTETKTGFIFYPPS